MIKLSIPMATARLERALIRRALAETKGNQTKASELLDISRRALIYKMAEYGLAKPAMDR